MVLVTLSPLWNIFVHINYEQTSDKFQILTQYHRLTSLEKSKMATS